MTPKATRAAAWVYLVLTAGVVAFHAALILGAPWGGVTMGGRWPGVLPAEGRLTSALSILMLVLFGRVVAERAGLARRWLPAWGIGVVILYLAAGVVAHVLTPVGLERAIWLPVILAQLVCVLLVLSRR
jgi:hypothetical protein